MASVSLRLRAGDIHNFSARMSELLMRLERPLPIMAKMAQYMANSTKVRLQRGSGSDLNDRAWDGLRPVTQELRMRAGFAPDRVLFKTGNLSRSIYVDYANDEGFAIASSAPYAGYQQRGVKRTGGFIKNKTIRDRPFLGFSDTNIERLSTMLRRYVEYGEL